MFQLLKNPAEQKFNSLILSFTSAWVFNESDVVIILLKKLITRTYIKDRIFNFDWI